MKEQAGVSALLKGMHKTVKEIKHLTFRLQATPLPPTCGVGEADRDKEPVCICALSDPSKAVLKLNTV